MESPKTISQRLTNISRDTMLYETSGKFRSYTSYHKACEVIETFIASVTALVVGMIGIALIIMVISVGTITGIVTAVAITVAVLLVWYVVLSISDKIITRKLEEKRSALVVHEDAENTIDDLVEFLHFYHVKLERSDFINSQGHIFLSDILNAIHIYNTVLGISKLEEQWKKKRN